jgi:enoyl-CoA hydratase
MTFETLLLEREAGVVTVTINRPKVLNALSVQTLADLQAAFTALGADPDVRAIVLTGAGDRAFVAGADINELSTLSADGAAAYARAGQAVLDAIAGCGRPVVAAINGYALGGGCELAMACTLRVAADTARFGQPEINLGLIPGFAGTQRLTRLVGEGCALELLLTGDPVPASRAYEMGLVNRVVPAADVRREATALAAQLAAKAPVAMRYILQAVRDGADLPLDRAQAVEAALFGLAAATDDMKEGTRAFLEKRAAAWAGR